MLLLLALLACSDPQPSPVEELAPPVGSIGGEPILPFATVMGAVANEAVEAVIDGKMAEINACYQAAVEENPKLRGKVLLKFTIDKEGKVASSKVRSTSLRHKPTEDCIKDLVATTAFPALNSGRLAIVNYPFAFPQEEKP
jgi:hypothetical protein